eukprot:2440471-Prymnesium_polylepis.1
MSRCARASAETLASSAASGARPYQLSPSTYSKLIELSLTPSSFAQLRSIDRRRKFLEVLMTATRALTSLGDDASIVWTNTRTCRKGRTTMSADGGKDGVSWTVELGHHTHYA